MSLWDNIRKRRASGKRMRKKGEKGAPTAAAMKSAQGEEATTTASIPNPADTQMGPRFTTHNVMDRRKKKNPTLLKRFRELYNA